MAKVGIPKGYKLGKMRKKHREKIRKAKTGVAPTKQARENMKQAQIMRWKRYHFQKKWGVLGRIFGR